MDKPPLFPGPRILIVTSGPLCRHPRVAKEATALGQAGFAVTVLTVAHTARFEAMDDVFLAGRPFRKLTVDLIGRGGGGRLTSILSRGATWLARKAAARGVQSIWALGPAPALARRAARLPAALTIVHTEAAFAAGDRLLRLGRRVAADFEDWHSEDLLPQDRRSRPLRLIRRLEQTLMRTAAYTSTTSAALAQSLQSRYGGRLPVVVRNAFPLQPDPATVRPAADRPGGPSLLWFSQVVGPGRMLESLLDAWSRTSPPSTLSLLGDVDPGYRSHLESRLPERFRARLHFLPLVPPDNLASLIAGHDVGLALEAGTPPSRDLTITNKILQYLNAGLAVVASATRGQREVLGGAPGAGLLVDPAETDGFASALDGLLGDSEAIRAMGRASRQAAETLYCWERQAPDLVAAVQDALKP